MEHIITNAETGEVTVVPFTPEEIAAAEASANAPPDQHLNNGALVRFSGASPIAIYENLGFAGVTRVSKGRYRVAHETPMPTDQYSAFPSVFDPLPRAIRITARTAAYVELRVTDLDGIVQDPTEVSVRTERVVTSP